MGHAPLHKTHKIMPKPPIIINSFFAQLYLDLQERIKAAVPEIQWIEQDFGQDTYDKWRPNVAFPAVLIDFPSANYESIGGGGQWADIELKLRLMVAPFEQSFEDAPIEVRKGALEFFELEHKLTHAIHGWAPIAPSPQGEGAGGEVYVQPFIRTRIISNNRNDIGLRIRELHFTTSYQEYE
jgi:hypothetical protein